ncbi:MAG: hypothetical protein ACK41D_03190 [Rubricoccaceae bacterium]
MNSVLHVSLIFLHVVLAAAWFGLGLALPALARSAMADGGAPVAALGRRVLLIMGVALVGFYVVAVGNFLTGGSVRVYGWPYHTAITLGLLLIGVHFLLLQPAWGQLVKGLGTPEADVARGRLGMAIGIGHTLWLVMLVLMYLPRFGVGMPRTLGLG